MTALNSLFTSESVTSGHPDKVCDRISDAILDELLAKDPDSHCAVETMVTGGKVYIAGEVTSSADLEIDSLVRKNITQIGYTDKNTGFDSECNITVCLDQQSPDIAAGVANSWEVRQGTNRDLYDRQGAGDQGMMFGYACNETPDYMPAPIWLSHLLARRLEEVRSSNELPDLLPDGKTQVTVRYEGITPVAIDAVVVSSQHQAHYSLEDLRSDIMRSVIIPELEKLDWAKDSDYKTLINPAGSFITGGPAGDTGLTGRKIIVDTYGGMARHGGGAFSGKDPSKVDRSAAYATRWVAKNVVAAGLAGRCEVQVAYAIGSAHPVSLRIDTFGTENHSVDKIEKAVAKVFDLRPAAIIDQLNLKRPIYTDTSAYGHFGRNIFPWESIDKTQELLAEL